MTSAIYSEDAATEVYSADAWWYVGQNSATIEQIAQVLGVSKTAIAGALAEEHTSYNSIDEAADAVVLATWTTHQEYSDNYFETGEDLGGEQAPNLLQKLTNPVYNDVGFANIKISTAIRLVRDYASTYDLGLGVDPLGLGAYVNNYALLANDLVVTHALTIKIYALMIQEAEAYFIENEAFGNDWASLPQEFKDALYVTYCNKGRTTIIQSHDINTAGGKPYEPMPGFITAAGMNHLRNAVQIGASVGETGYGSEVLPVSSGSFAVQAHQNSQEGLAYRYALLKLHAVALPTLNFTTRNQNGELNLYDPETGTGATTDQWITDRTAMLAVKIQFDVTGTDYSNTFLGSSVAQYGNAFFRDIESGISLRILGAGELRYFVFGSETSDALEGGGGGDYLYGRGGDDTLHGGGGTDYLEGGTGNDTLLGGSENDFLVGMEGNDTLEGGAGNDVLEGGLGNDTYVIRAQEGADIITDKDGLGTIVFNGQELTEGFQVSSNTWRSKDGLFTYALSDNGQGAYTLVIDGPGNQVVINDFQLGQFGIQLLPAEAAEPPVQSPVFGSPFDDHEYDEDHDHDSVTASTEGGPPRNESLFGNGGNDIIRGNGGSDVSYGGDGNDFIVSHGEDYDDAGEGGDPNQIGDIVFGEAGRDVLGGSDGRDELYGGADADLLVSLGGDDLLDGGEHDDLLSGGQGADILLGGDGVDVLLGDGLLDVWDYNHVEGVIWDYALATNEQGFVTGVSYQNFYIVILNDAEGAGDDLLMGGAGNDFLMGEHGDDFLFGEDDNDTLLGGGEADVLVGGLGHDWLVGDDIAGDELETGGDDLLEGGDGNDFLFGVAGNDVLFGGAGNDELQGDYEGLPSNLHGDDLLDGGAGDDILFGQGGNDTLRGGDDADQIFGGEGNDVLFGDDGNDYLFGDSGSDTLEGGVGLDVLIGGDGYDYYRIGGDLDFILDDQSTGGLFAFSAMSESGTNGIEFTSSITANDVTIKPFVDTTDGTFYLIVRTQAGDLAAIENGHLGTISDYVFSDSSELTNDEMTRRVSGVVVDSTTLATINGTTNDDYLKAGDVRDTTLTAGNGDDWLYGGIRNDFLSGGSGTDLLMAGDGNDVLHGGSGTNYLDGGAGRDSLWNDSGNDLFIFGVGYGHDTVVGGLGTTTGNLDKIWVGTSQDRATLHRRGDNLYVVIDESPDQLLVQNYFSSDQSTAGARILFADGTMWTDADILSRLNVEGAANSQTGTSGDDSFLVDNVADTVTDNVDAGVDTVQSSVSFTLSANIENLSLTGFLNIDGTGNALDNVLTGNAGSNILIGNGGNDTFIGGAGDDIYNIGSGGIVIENSGEGIDSIVTSSQYYALDDNVENLTTTSMSIFQVYAIGNALDNVIRGNLNNGTQLDGGLGADTLIGGRQGDKYYVDNVGDVLIEEGDFNTSTDIVFSSIDWTLGGDFENLTLIGTGTTTGTGNVGVNILNGSQNSAANTLAGGGGTDTYIINGNDIVVENADEGTDTVELVNFSGVYTLTDNVENARLGSGSLAASLTGNSSDNVLQGNDYGNTLGGGDGNDTLYGNWGSDILDGGAGADYMNGYIGDDTYVVDDSGDVVVEYGGNGTDTVRSYLSYSIVGDPQTYGDVLENVVLLGSSEINATGNALDNSLDGSQNSAANVLTGGLGNDSYIVGTGDSIVENADEGNDTVVTSVSYTLADNLENITLSGTDAISATGSSDANTLDGSQNSGANTLTGGAGDDSYVVGVGDIIVESAGEGTDTVTAASDFTLGEHIENLILAEGGHFSGTGNAQDNSITGNGWNNLLDGGAGADTLAGGSGSDTYVVDDVGDVVVEVQEDFYTDTVLTSVTYTLGADIENLTLTGSSAISGTGNSLRNYLDGSQNSAANVLTGGDGDDVYIVGFGDSVIEAAAQGDDTVRSDSSYTLGANIEDLELLGTGNLNGTGNSLGNTLYGNAGNNRLDGGTGADSLYGGLGDDTYVVENTSDYVEENTGEGIDTIESSITRTLAANFENLTLTGSGNINGTGNSLDNVLTGNAGTNTLTGGAGNDTYYVGTGDTVTESSGAGTDTVMAGVTWTLGNNTEHLTLTGTGNINGTGNSLANTLTGNAGNNRLDGGTGADTLIGGAGNDTYVVDNAADVIIEGAGGGTDAVETNASYTLGAEIENLTLSVSSGINGTGNASNNQITGNSGANRLDGGAGNDTLIGGTGNDTYVVDSASDVVTEAASAGTDTVESSVTYTLGTNVENLTLTGSGNINGTGNTLANVLRGNSDANVLAGGTGNDTYHVSTGDTVTEAASAGTDTVNADVSWTLATNVENLVLTGTGNIDGTGNSAVNQITGNSGNNRLDGGAGNDTMIGGAGNDTYVVNSTSDVVTEGAGAGTDTIESSVTLTSLAANVENLTLTGSSNINGTGNTLDNVMTGNSGTNTLFGGTGNDTYYVTTGDTVTEAAGQGTDTVVSGGSWTLGNEIENLTLTGTSAINGTGNSLANVLTGNDGINTLDGAAGADTYRGGLGNDVLGGAIGSADYNGVGNTYQGELGNDTLRGSAGADNYLFNRGDGQDLVQENAPNTANDQMNFGTDIAIDQLWFSQQGDDLNVSIIGTDSHITIDDWYLGSNQRVEEFRTTTGMLLVESQVQQLVDAMAAFSPPPPGQLTLTPEMAAQLNPVITTAWQPAP